MTGSTKNLRVHLTDEDLLQKLRCAEGLGARVAVDSEKAQGRAEDIAAEHGIDVAVIIRACARRVG
jgi:hypothetical protein